MKSWRYAGEKGVPMDTEKFNKWMEMAKTVTGGKFWTEVFDNPLAEEFLFEEAPSPNRNGPPPAGYPCADIAETAQEILVLVDLPGVRKEDIQLSLNSGQLHLKGIVRTGLPGEALHLSERRRGEFERSFVMPRRIEGVCGPVKAALQEGLLIVRIPVADPPHTRIPIE
ncbi:Hsp20/alpha crystallin family protein [Paenibacillus aurantius]|uniref:Hsp20/alpha crystallin family protein n=1 Tax=Paenibacillus aurantius TaxID=2918900 RepID=A0AA96RG58_9BACL|nr:Hsp20/alpha crystallin family protein [Paenibacillus aurantius]WNQ12717.1 Hsp20/alpha crystallin family protein [Paenibacillus aurantius]